MFGFTQLILLSLTAGVCAGLFFGDMAAPLQVVGSAYVGLLQMTVLPYILFSLISNIGRLNKHQAGMLARVGLVIMLTLWVLVGLVVIVMAQTLPVFSSGSFFSTALIDEVPSVDFIRLFVPANLFASLNNNAVPAVVVFCLLFGIALIGMDNKNTLLAQTEVVVETLQRVNKMVIKLTPIGVFAISASAAGTLTLDQFGRLQAYVLVLSAGAMLLVIVIFPLLINLMTGLSWRRVLYHYRDVVITATVLGSVFAIIPMLIECSKAMLEEIEEAGTEEQSLPELVLPLAYPFADAGKVLTLVFIPFAGWFYGSPLSLGELFTLIALGPILLFGKVIMAVPFLLDFYRIPADIFQLFLASGVVLGRLADATGAAHLVTFTVITASILAGRRAIRWLRVMSSLIAASLALLLTALGVHWVLANIYEDGPDKTEILLGMEIASKHVEKLVFDEAQANPLPLGDMSYSTRIAKRGVLRVGFIPDHLPFSFVNAQGDLVGLDVNLIEVLAADINVSLEFVPYSVADISEGFERDYFDVAISGITATATADRVGYFSDAYMYVNMGMVIPDYQKRDFALPSSIRDMEGLRIGVLKRSYFMGRARFHFPDAEIVLLDSERDFFEKPALKLDVLMTTAEGGSAWTLLYPRFTTIDPVDNVESAPLVFAIPEEMDMEEFIEVWIQLKKLDGTIDGLVDYWIKGQLPGAKPPRWSVIRDVLHWVD
jgi:Na+/H+-dicarboxylate symporter/ABC-type amino acid transport substrate-binding protein